MWQYIFAFLLLNVGPPARNSNIKVKDIVGERPFGRRRKIEWEMEHPFGGGEGRKDGVLTRIYCLHPRYLQNDSRIKKSQRGEVLAKIFCLVLNVRQVKLAKSAANG